MANRGWTAKRIAGAALGAGAGLAAWRAARYIAAPRPLPPGERERIVILGAGFGGMAALDELSRRIGGDPRVDVLLVDRNNFQLFTPMLYQVATGIVRPDHISYPLRARVRAAGARFQESLVEGIDLDARAVVTDDGTIPYDTLVVALGSVSNFFGLRDVARHSLTLKTLGDGITLRNRIIDAFEQADVTTRDPERRRELLTFNLVGAGATGVELATSIDNLVRLVLLRDYPRIRPEEIRIRLIEAKERALPEMTPGVSALATRKLGPRGIELLTDTAVAGVADGRLRAQDSTLLAPGTTVWTAGVRANPVVRGLPVERGQGDRVAVDEFLQLPGYPRVFLVGDNTLVDDPGTGRPVPPNAPAAIQMGQSVARNIESLLRREPPQPFRYHFEGELLSLGRNQAIVNYRGALFDGFPAWVMWRAFYLSQLRGWENRAGVLVDWAFSYFAQRRESSRLVCEPVIDGVDELAPR